MTEAGEVDLLVMGGISRGRVRDLDHLAALILTPVIRVVAFGRRFGQMPPQSGCMQGRRPTLVVRYSHFYEERTTVFGQKKNGGASSRIDG